MTAAWAWITDHATVLSAVGSALVALVVAVFTLEFSGRQRLQRHLVELERQREIVEFKRKPLIRKLQPYCLHGRIRTMLLRYRIAMVCLLHVEVVAKGCHGIPRLPLCRC